MDYVVIIFTFMCELFTWFFIYKSYRSRIKQALKSFSLFPYMMEKLNV